MSKSIEELMKPRFKVIADYPNSDFEIGEIIHSNLNGHFLVYTDNQSLRLAPEAYPAVFKPLAWWEERQESEMPEYVIKRDMEDSQGNSVPDVVLKVIKHFSAGNGEWRDDSIRIFCANSYLTGIRTSFSYAGWEPATELEYTSYINK